MKLLFVIEVTAWLFTVLAGYFFYTDSIILGTIVVTAAARLHLKSVLVLDRQS